MAETSTRTECAFASDGKEARAGLLCMIVLIQSIPLQQVADLQEQLRDLMFHLQAESKIKEATTTETQSSTQASTASPVTQEELEESVIEVGSAPQKSRRRKKK